MSNVAINVRGVYHLVDIILSIKNVMASMQFDEDNESMTSPILKASDEEYHLMRIFATNRILWGLNKCLYYHAIDL